MRVAIRERVRLPVPPEVLFDYVTSDEGFRSFPGFGPIPGIRAIELVEGDLRTEGSRARVTNTDGSTHRERVITVDRPARYAIRIHDLSSPFRFLVTHVDERWDIRPAGDHSDVERVFEFELRTPFAWPLSLPLGHLMFRAAMRRHHRALRGWSEDNSRSGSDRG